MPLSCRMTSLCGGPTSGLTRDCFVTISHWQTCAADVWEIWWSTSSSSSSSSCRAHSGQRLFFTRDNHYTASHKNVPLCFRLYAFCIVSVETGMNILQSTYLVIWWRQNCITSISQIATRTACGNVARQLWWPRSLPAFHHWLRRTGCSQNSQRIVQWSSFPILVGTWDVLLSVFFYIPAGFSPKFYLQNSLS